MEKKQLWRKNFDQRRRSRTSSAFFMQAGLVGKGRGILGDPPGARDFFGQVGN